MRRFALAVLAAVSAASAAFAAPVELEPATEARLEAGERQRVIVEFAVPSVDYARERGASDREIAALIDQARNGALQRSFGRPAGVMATLDTQAEGPVLARAFRYTPAAAMILSAEEIERLARDPGVARIVEDGLDAISLDQSVALIGGTTMHNRGVTGAGTAIAILDTGVDHEHAMFSGRIAASACFSSTVSDQSTSLCQAGAQQAIGDQAGDNCEPLYVFGDGGVLGCEHGTHVAGIALGSRIDHPDTPGTELVGVAPGAQLIAVQVFSRFEGEDYCGAQISCAYSYVSDQIAALEWLYAERTNLPLAVINMSLGGGAYADACLADPRVPIISALRDAGIATVVATGNESLRGEISAPACIPAAIAVGSNYFGSYSNDGFWRDVLAPGDDITSAIPAKNDAESTLVAELSGTSMATPHVAGAIALLREASPVSGVSQVENALLSISNARGALIRVDQSADELALHGGNRVGPFLLDDTTPVRLSYQYGGTTENPRALRLTNTSGSPADWRMASDDDWIRFSLPGSTPVPSALEGTLAAGASITVHISANAETRSVGEVVGQVRIGAPGASDLFPLFVLMRVLSPVPPNDNFADAMTFGPSGGGALADNLYATAEAGEPAHAGRPAGASLWWTFTPDLTATYQIQAAAVGFNPVLAVYTGDTLETLSAVASNDDYNGSTNPTVVSSLTAGTTYRIALAGYDGDEQGTATLVIGRGAPVPANDLISNAIEISGNRGRFSAYLGSATRTPDEADRNGPTIWYRWTVPADGTYGFLAEGTDTSQVYVDIFDDPAQTPDSARHGYREDMPYAFAVTATAGEVLYVGVRQPYAGPYPVHVSWYPLGEQAAPLRSAILPNNRSVTFGNWITAFATLVNPVSYGRSVTDCRILPPADFSGEFHYQTTDPATNAVTGTPDTPVSLQPGGSQSFLLSFRSLRVESRSFDLRFDCSNESTPPATFVNSFQVATTRTPQPDLIHIAVTPTGNGIMEVQRDRTRAFSVAVINAGGPGNVGITMQRYHATSMSFCETDPSNGACVSSRSNQLSVDFARGQIRTFTVFVAANRRGEIPFDPLNSRVGLHFLASGSGEAGTASVALRLIE